MTALVGFARELELQGVLEDLVGAQRKIVERSGLLGEREDQLVHVGVQLVGNGCHRCSRLVLPEGVLEAEESGPARIVDTLRQAVGAPVDLIVEVPEGVVGCAQAGVVEMGDQPSLLCLIQLSGIGQSPQAIGVGGQNSKTCGYLRSILCDQRGDLAVGHLLVRVRVVNRLRLTPSLLANRRWRSLSTCIPAGICLVGSPLSSCGLFPGPWPRSLRK